MNRNDANFVASELERMLAMPLQPEAALQAWYDAAHSFDMQTLERGLSDDIPVVVRHFLSDADIRSKDNEVEYRQRQEAAVKAFVAGLRGKQ